MVREERKTVRFNVRLTEAQNDELRDAAEVSRRSVSSLVREGIDMVTREIRDRKANRQVEQGAREAEG